MADTRLNIILGAKDEATKTVTGIRKQFELFKKDAIKGFGLATGFHAFNYAKRAVEGVVDVIGDAIQAAAEEEASIAQLTRAIEENDQAWDGNMDAIEAVIRAREDLAFADDEQRDSLRQLVSVTKDVNEALSLQRTAMDLARLRGMSLADAGTLVGKVYAGNLGILSRYGIVLKRGTTATEALAEIQKRAAGQAQTYADKTAGSQLRAQIALNDAMEEFGGLVTPLVAEFASFTTGALRSLTDGLSALGTALDDLGDLANPAAVAQSALNDELARLAEEAGIPAGELEAYAARVKAATAASEVAARVVGQDLAGGFGQAEVAIDGAVKSEMDLIREQERAAARGEATTETLEKQNDVLREAQDIRSAYLMDLEQMRRNQANAAFTGAALAQNLQDVPDAAREAGQALYEASDFAAAGAARIAAAVEDIGPSIRQTIKDGKSDVRAAMADLRWAMEHPFAGDKYVDFLERKQERAQAKLEAAIRGGNIPAANAAAALVASVQAELEKLDDQTYSVNVMVDPATGRRRSGGAPGRAAGGPVHAGQTYVIGERGPELLHMGAASGSVTPNHAIGGHGHTIVMDGRVVGELVDERLGRRYATTARGGGYRSAA